MYHILFLLIFYNGKPHKSRSAMITLGRGKYFRSTGDSYPKSGQVRSMVHDLSPLPLPFAGLGQDSGDAKQGYLFGLSPISRLGRFLGGLDRVFLQLALFFFLVLFFLCHFFLVLLKTEIRFSQRFAPLRRRYLFTAPLYRDVRTMYTPNYPDREMAHSVFASREHSPCLACLYRHQFGEDAFYFKIMLDLPAPTCEYVFQKFRMYL